jgi:hypothetical protein
LVTIKRLLRSIAGASEPTDASAAGRVAGALDALRDEVARLEGDLRGLADLAQQQRQALDALVARQVADISETARLAALSGARVRSTSIAVTGSAGRRSAIRRHEIGAAVALPVRPWMGVTAFTSPQPDVRALWDRLLEAEARSEGYELRGLPSTVLEFQQAVVAKGEMLQVSLPAPAAPRPGPATPHAREVIVPRFTHDFLKRKLRNVGHWLLDCLPHMLALDPLAPHALFLLPPLPAEVHWESLALVGVPRERVLTWDGGPVACDRLLVQETEGRIVRGRPLPALLAMRRRALASAPGPSRGHRRIYISRRDATSSRQWVANEREVEALFEQRGFELLVMAGMSLEQQMWVFREAQVVAGVSGAGLADILFANPGTHVITLLSDSLIRWYADQAGTRSRWVRAKSAPLSALSDSPRFYAHLAAAFEQHCHTFVGEDAMPLEALGGFVDDVLAQVDRE